MNDLKNALVTISGGKTMDRPLELEHRLVEPMDFIKRPLPDYPDYPDYPVPDNKPPKKGTSPETVAFLRDILTIANGLL